jgi:hypothetical protein
MVPELFGVGRELILAKLEYRLDDWSFVFNENKKFRE